MVKEATAKLPKDTPVEIWFQDEMRIGQKNGVTRLWAKKGTRPRQPKDQRYANAYIFGAICPGRGSGAALVRPYCDTPAMEAHLEEISLNVASGSHAAVIMPLGDCQQSPAGNRQGRMAHNRQAQPAKKHLCHPAATTFTRAQPPGKYLAVFAAKLALKPCF